MTQTKRHPKLAKMTSHLDAEEFAEWIRMFSVETFEDTERRYFSEEEIAEFEHESSKNGREFNKLSDIKKEISEIITKGTEKEITFTVKPTVGTKMLETQRRQNDDLVEKRYEEIEIEIFGVVNQEDETMEYFTLDGEMMEKRTRLLTPKEKHKHLGMFMKTSKQGNDIVDETTGEVLKKASGE